MAVKRKQYSTFAIFVDLLKEFINYMIFKCNLQVAVDTLLCCFDTYPVLSVILLLIASVYAVPITLFLIFGTATFLFSFTGFLIVEGTLIGVALIILLSVLSTMTIIIGTALLVTWILYAIILKMYEQLSFINDFQSGRNRNHVIRSLHVVSE